MLTTRILIVEDEAIICAELKSTLRSLGHDVVASANSGEEAIEKADIHRPDLVLMDIKLEGKIDGIEAAQIIQFKFGIPIIFLTAYADNKTVAKAKLTMPIRYLLKPVQEQELKIAVEMASYIASVESEKRKAEQTLRESETQMRSVFEAADNVAFVSTDLGGVDTKIVGFSPGAEKIFGYTSEEVIGKPVHIIHRREQVLEFYAMQEKLKQEEKGFSGEDILVRKSGEPFPVLFTVHPKLDGEENIIGTIGVFIDISDRKQMEEKMMLAREQAVKANRAKSEFLANMSHELRTPLNGILGFTQVLQLKNFGELNEKQMGYLNHISESGAHLLNMVNDILDLAKVESGMVELSKAPFDFEAMLRRLPLNIESIAFKKEIEILRDIENGLGWLYGDEVRIKQVLYNLFSNAVKFTNYGKHIGIEAKTMDDTISVTVWDEGIGIPEKHLEKIFNPFEQVDSTSKKEEDGTGLGLTISRKMIELHGGKLFATSQVGEGSRFTFQLPGRFTGKPPEADARFIAVEQSKTPKSKASILVVEDNTSNQVLIKAILEMDDYRSDLAVDGEKAIEMVAEKEYDLILMDIQLPGIDGVDAMKKIREVSGAHLPIIVTTAFAMKGDVEKYLGAGFDDYISKPIDIVLLRQKIIDILDK